MRNDMHVQSRRTRRAAVAAALVVSGVLGTAVAVSALSSGDDPAPSPPAAAVPASDPAPGRGFTSADAAERWAIAADQARIELCTARPISADGLEHCIEGGR
jgi:hypothetical protein